jgi:RNA exonuclease 1
MKMNIWKIINNGKIYLFRKKFNISVFSRVQVLASVPDIVERSLEEVQEDLQILFDDDSILAGHSVENDLKYLQIYYPYIIDTSIIFNVSGTRLEKASLQKLYAIFLG